MANLFAYEWYGQAAQWSGPPSSIVDGPYAAARYSVELEQQLAALKRSVATLRHRQTTDPCLEAAQPAAACADCAGFTEVEHYLSELEHTVGAFWHCGKYYHDIVHSQPDPICRFGTDFKLTFANETFATLYNKPLTELLSTSLLALLPDTEQAAVTAQLTALTPSAPMTTVETSVVSADGAQRWFAWTYQLLADDQDHFLEVQAIGRDVTAHKQAITAEREQRYLAEALRDSLAALTGPLPLDEMMQRILDATATVVPNEAGSIILFEQTQARVAYARGFTPTATAFFHDYRFALHELVLDGVITNACAYLVPDTVTDPDWLPLPVSAWIRSSIGVPIVLRGQPIGLLMLDSATPHTFQPTDVDKLQLFAQYASLALENADHIRQLEERVAARTTELQVAKAQVETILQHSPDAIFLVAPDLRIQQTNTAFQTMMGGEAVATFTGSLLDLIAAAEAAYVTATLHAVITQNTSQHVEVCACRYDGVRFDGELSIAPLQGGSFICTLRDISKRKAYERHLRFYASIQDNLSDAVITTDMTFHIQSWNRAAETIYGWRADEVIGKPVQEVLQTQYVSAAVREEMRQKLFQREGWQGEVVQQRRDGASLHILGSVTLFYDGQGAPLGVVAVNHNITERKRTENALRESEAQLRQIVTTMRGGLVLYDLAEQITYANERFCTLSGYSLAELVGSSSFDYVDEASAQLIQDQLIYRRQGEGTSYELVIKRKDGQRIDCLVSGSPLYDEQQTLIGSIAVITDITAQKQAEVLLQEMLQKERELSALKSRVVTTASHELRTPLASILVFTDTLRAYRHKLSDEQVSQRLNGIGDQVNFLRTIIDDLLQLEQLQTGRSELQRTPVDLNLLCRSVLNEFLAQENFRHQMSYRCDAALPMLALDKRLMRQVLVNLVGNALKYSAPATTVCVHLVYTNTQLYISVQDEGIGIPAADLAHLFQPFQRASNVGAIGGTGLGLAIAKEAAEAHGGTITVASEVGKGTTFTVAIPVASKGVLRQ